MIRFNQLRITGDGRNFIIDAVMPYSSEFPNAYISQLIIDTGDTFVESGPSSEPVLVKNYPEGTLDIYEDFKSLDTPVSFNQNIFFVYVVVEGLPDSYDECLYGHQTTIASAVNLYPFYQNLMNYLKQIEAKCEEPRDFIDGMLKLKGLEISLLTGNYIEAINMWNKYFKKHTVQSVPCNCGK